MSKTLVPAFFAALLSSGLFLLVLGLGTSFLFLFLPTLPLFSLGLSRQSKAAPPAAAMATLIVGIVAGPNEAGLYIFFLALPAFYLAHKALLNQNKQWFPLGQALNTLTLYACAAVALTTLWYIGEPGGLPGLLSQNIHETFADLEEEYGEVVTMLADRLSFLIFSICIWMWGLGLYTHGWLANRALTHKGQNLRPNFAIEPFTLPSWMLNLLGICGLAALIGGTTVAFVGKSCLISLLLSYFFSGAALLQKWSTTWPSRKLFLFFIYFLVFAQFWPALVLSGIGLWHQIKHLSGGTSSTTR